MALGRRVVKPLDFVVSAQDLPPPPAHPFYQRLNRLLEKAGFDAFVEALCRPYYADGIGRPGIPPGIYFRMLLIGYFEGLDSQRGIAWRCSDSRSLQTFLGYLPHEATPEHSSLTKVRQRLPEVVHEEVFAFVLKMADAHGLLRAKTVAVDATTLEANASLKTIRRRDNGDDWKAYLRKLAAEAGIQDPSDADLRRFDRRRKGKKVSNKDWESPSDPDSRIAKMKDGTTHLTNPPFGKKSSIAIVGEDGDIEKEDLAYERNDFWTTTKNKQLNFVQHVKTMLESNGRCAIVVPDNVLFEGGAGETVRRKLLEQCDVHTLLRLPTGIFYAQGVKANVLFFDAKPGREWPWTEKVWVYDLRTNMHFTLKTKPLKRADLDEFVDCFNPDNRHKRRETWSEKNLDGRWRCFSYEELAKRDKLNLDIFWIKDKSLEDAENLPEPDELAEDIADDLEMALEQFRAIGRELKG
jgi:transposase